MLNFRGNVGEFFVKLANISYFIMLYFNVPLVLIFLAGKQLIFIQKVCGPGQTTNVTHVMCKPKRLTVHNIHFFLECPSLLASDYLWRRDVPEPKFERPCNFTFFETLQNNCCHSRIFDYFLMKILHNIIKTNF